MPRLFLYASVLTLFALPALAQTSATPVPGNPATLPQAGAQSMPPQSDLATAMPALDATAMDDNAPIRLSPDGPAIITLDRDAGTVIVGNPEHATVQLQNPRMIMLMPGTTGATRIIALDRNGKSILDRHVLVGSDRAGIMRIDRVCALGNKGCQAQTAYYCPDKCYETAASAPDENAGAANTSVSPASSTSSAPQSANPPASGTDNAGTDSSNSSDNEDNNPTTGPTETYQEQAD